MKKVNDKQKPYICEFCVSEFFQKNSMRAYIKSVHEGKKSLQLFIEA